MKQLSTAEVTAMSTVMDPPVIMNTRERRQRAYDIAMKLGLTSVMADYENVRDRHLLTCGLFQTLAADPKLKAAGLNGPTAGHISDFFHWSEHQMHMMFCYCHHHMDVTVHGSAVANAIRGFGM